MSGGTMSAKRTLFAELERAESDAESNWNAGSQAHLNRLLVQALAPSFNAEFVTKSDLKEAIDASMKHMDDKLEAHLAALDIRFANFTHQKPHPINAATMGSIIAVLAFVWGIVWKITL